MSGSELKKVAKSRFKDVLNGVQIKVHRGSDGVLHLRSYDPCSAVNAIQGALEAAQEAETPRSRLADQFRDPWGYRERVEVPYEDLVPVLDLLSNAGCQECLKGSFYGAFDSIRHFEDVVEVLGFETRLKSMTKLTSKTTPTVIQKRKDEAKTAVRRLGDLRDGGDVLDAVQDACDELISAFEAAGAAMSAASQDEETRAKVEAKIKKMMVPERFIEQDIELDTTLHLIGVSPTPSWHGREVGAVVDAFSLRSDSATVLLAPAYVYAFLLQQLFPKGGSQTLVVSYEAPADPEVREIAAGIWDPEGTSTLACMKKAIASAEALSGE